MLILSGKYSLGALLLPKRVVSQAHFSPLIPSWLILTHVFFSNRYYHTGIGSKAGESVTGIGLKSWIEGARATGIHTIIRDAYTFICHNFNFDHGEDEIYLVGFSRGAFAARCVASLINDIGLLNKRGLQNLPVIYDLWAKPRQYYIPDGVDIGFGSFRSSAHFSWNWQELQVEDVCRFLRENNFIQREIKVKACSVWDSVSALTARASKRLSFVDHTVPLAVENAFQALALNEKRRDSTGLLTGSLAIYVLTVHKTEAMLVPRLTFGRWRRC
jgi:uncharacterized protein (DUF2235 family)